MVKRDILSLFLLEIIETEGKYTEESELFVVGSVEVIERDSLPCQGEYEDKLLCCYGGSKETSLV